MGFPRFAETSFYVIGNKTVELASLTHLNDNSYLSFPILPFHFPYLLLNPHIVTFLTYFTIYFSVTLTSC